MRGLGLTAGAALLVLAGCGGGEQASSAATPTSTATAAPTTKAQPTGTGAEGKFLLDVRATGLVAGYTDQSLLDLGHGACDALDDGATPAGLLLSARESGSGDAGAAILGTAASTLCREHLPAVQEVAGSPD